MPKKIEININQTNIDDISRQELIDSALILKHRLDSRLRDILKSTSGSYFTKVYQKFKDERKLTDGSFKKMTDEALQNNVLRLVSFEGYESSNRQWVKNREEEMTRVDNNWGGLSDDDKSKYWTAIDWLRKNLEWKYEEMQTHALDLPTGRGIDWENVNYINSIANTGSKEERQMIDILNSNQNTGLLPANMGSYLDPNFIFAKSDLLAEDNRYKKRRIRV